jgi:hypothetical protein
MSTLTAPALAPTLQALIDLRLDTIDRLLLSHLPRQDRVNIVSEVEAQIFELLAERGDDEPTRDDVLAVLARLDPPEAYVPEDAALLERPTAQREPTRAFRNQQSAISNPQSRREGRAGKAGGILGLVAIGFVLMAPIIYLLALLAGSEELLIFGLLLAAGSMFVTGVLGIIFSIYAGLRGPWSVTGVVTSGVALFIWLCACFVFLAAGGI